MSYPNSLAPKLVSDNTPSAETEPLARPKVMRRPTHFSNAPSAPSIPIPKLPTEVEASAPLPAASLPVRMAWQDDARFGLVMLVIVVLVNIGIMLWLPHIHTVLPTRGAAPTEGQAVFPAEIRSHGDDAAVTLYTKPAPVAHDEGSTAVDPIEEGVPMVHILGQSSQDRP